MLIQGDGCNEPAPTMYSPNDGTYITCTETMEYADVPYFPRDRLTGRKKKYRTSSDTLKLQRLIEYLKSTGSEAGAKLDESAQDYLNKIQVKVSQFINRLKNQNKYSKFDMSKSMSCQGHLFDFPRYVKVSQTLM